MNIEIPTIPEVRMMLRYYNHGELVHDRDVDYFDVQGLFEAEEELERCTPNSKDWNAIQVIQKELYGYQIHCFKLGSTQPDQIYVATIEPFLEYKDSRFKLTPM